MAATKRKRPLSDAQRAHLEKLAERNRQRAAGAAPPPEQFPNPLDTHAPKRETARTRIPATMRKDAKTILAFGIAGLDKGARLLSDRSGSGFWTAEDQLSQDETTHLVNAVYAELSDYPKIVAAIASLGTGQKHAYVLYVATMIALPRLIRHGLLREDDPLVSAVLFAQLAVAGQVAPPDDDAEPEPERRPEPAVSVAPGPAYGDRWGNGNGQVHAGIGVVIPAPVDGGLSEQAG